MEPRRAVHHTNSGGDDIRDKKRNSSRAGDHCRPTLVMVKFEIVPYPSIVETLANSDNRRTQDNSTNVL